MRVFDMAYIYISNNFLLNIANLLRYRINCKNTRDVFFFFYYGYTKM